MSETGSQPRATAWQNAVTVLQEAAPPSIPEGAHAMTIAIEYPPGDPGTPPHRHAGPAFGYVLEGEMVFELEGEAPRVVRAGETFWEPGGETGEYRRRSNPFTGCGPTKFWARIWMLVGDRRLRA